MIENKVSALHQKAIHGAVAVAGGFAWADNTRERSNGLLRILPVDRQNITADTLWPAYRLELKLAGVVDPLHAVVAPGFCARGDMTTEEALRRP